MPTNRTRINKFKYSKCQKYAIKWLTFFSILCFVNSILVIKFGFFGDIGGLSIFILPFAHLSLIVVPFIFYSWYRLFRDKYIGSDEQYIKDNYPVIWKKLRPRGDYTFNSFASIRFIKGKYDDGTDDRLNHIKFKNKVNGNLMCWPFLLTVVVWLFNILLIFSQF